MRCGVSRVANPDAEVITLRIEVQITLWARLALWFARLLIMIGAPVDPDRAAHYIVRHIRLRGVPCG